MIHKHSRFLTQLAAVGLAVAAPGCDDDAPTGPPACTSVSAECEPLFEPAFDPVYRNVIERSCAVSGGACHAAEAGQGGLAFSADDPDGAYRTLLDGGYVAPGDASCSELVVRIESDDPAVLMPRGSPLAESARCAIVQWIEAGATR